MSYGKVPRNISEVPTPCVLVDSVILKRNAKKMLDTAKSLGVQLRPHMKTHKTLEIGELMTEGTKTTISVSTIEEALFFAAGDFKDILYAVPITENKIKTCQEIIKDVPDLKLLFSSHYGVQCMNKYPRGDGKKWSAILEVDCGYGRTGLEWDGEAIIEVAEGANKSDNVDFMGLYTHCGDTYDAGTVEGIRKVNDVTSDRLVEVANRLKSRGVACPTVGCGSTPGCNNPSQKMANLTEIHPGCYIFNDYEGVLNKSCSLSDVAIKVATRVIDHKKSTNCLIVDCGFLALSLDGMLQENNYEGMCIFQDHPELKLKGMTQELGKVTVSEGQMEFEKYPIGTMLYIYPFHACHTAAMHPVYYAHMEDKITDIWRPVRGW